MTEKSHFTSDWDELLSHLLGNEVEFLIVGGHALAAYGAGRYTEDLDIFVQRSHKNAEKILSAFKAFFGSDVGMTLEQFTTPNKVTMIGNKPFRVDILTTIDGVEFTEAYAEANKYKMGNSVVPVISLKHLRINKEKSAREKDLLDLAALRKLS